MEGMNPLRDDAFDAVALLVVPVPTSPEAEEGWPSHEPLAACGARFDRSETPRVVEIEGRRFVEGYLEHETRQPLDERLEALGRGGPNETNRFSMQ